MSVTPERLRKPLGIVWFRRDLRIADNPALGAATATEATRASALHRRRWAGTSAAVGGAARWWRGRSLLALERSLGALGVRLGGADHLQELADFGTQASAVLRQLGRGAEHLGRAGAGLQRGFAYARDVV